MAPGRRLRETGGLLILTAGTLLAGTLYAQAPRNFLQRVFGVSAIEDKPLLSAAAPEFTFSIENLDFRIELRNSNSAHLTVAGVPLELDVQYERQSGIDLYTVRPTAESARQGEQIKLNWTFPEDYNSR